MSKLKDITKELTGRALSPFHRKTGLNQLERNNEMQDGILDGILSQVDDAYITKTEQSSVMHLDGSGDGVVVLDSLEGNTLVNMVKSYNTNDFVYSNAVMQSDGYFKIQYGIDVNTSYVRPKLGVHIYKPNTTYTVIVDIKENTCGKKLGMSAIHSAIETLSPRDFSNTLGISTSLITTRSDISVDSKGDPTRYDLYFGIWEEDGGDLSKHITFRYWILEGDWTNRDLPPYFEGLQSSFEEKVNDEGKYEVEILSYNNGNLFDGKTENGRFTWISGENHDVDNPHIAKRTVGFIEVIEGATLYTNKKTIRFLYDKNKKYLGNEELGKTTTSTAHSNPFVIPKGVKYMRFYWGIDYNLTDCYIGYSSAMSYTLKPKQNKIKFQLNEPLRAVGDVKDRLCVRDGRLVVERKCKQLILNGTDELTGNWYWNIAATDGNVTRFFLHPYKIKKMGINNIICNNMPTTETYAFTEGVAGYLSDGRIYYKVLNTKASTVSELKTYLSKNPSKTVFELSEPYYEEVTNEYGQPIILEGYENGTLYIDSTITPTTTVRYTPKMEAFSVCNEIQENNVALSSDINDNIITYMMEVDYMITEKELNSASVCSVTQRMEVLDMTSMQKRTFDMLARLFKGKTLTKEECETRVTVYLSAGKITDEQAEELMLLIAETYQ